MIHPASRIVYVSDQVGAGVVASKLLPKGTIVWTQDALDRVFPNEQLSLLSQEVRAELTRFAHIDERGRHVLCWDAGKLINHSCEPTLRGVGTWFQVARRDILPGEELTCDYAECNIREALSCACASPQCRGSILGRDLLQFAEAWDKEAHQLLALLRTVEQPLWPYLLHEDEAQAFVCGQLSLPSFQQLYAGAQQQ